MDEQSQPPRPPVDAGGVNIMLRHAAMICFLALEPTVSLADTLEDAMRQPYEVYPAMNARCPAIPLKSLDESDMPTENHIPHVKTYRYWISKCHDNPNIGSITLDTRDNTMTLFDKEGNDHTTYHVNIFDTWHDYVVRWHNPAKGIFMIASFCANGTNVEAFADKPAVNYPMNNKLLYKPMVCDRANFYNTLP